MAQDITFHGLRGSGISALIESNKTDSKSVQNWARHKDIETTLQYYAKVKNQKSKMTVSEAMETIIGE